MQPTTARSGAPPQCSGFTLIEVIVALGLLATVAAASTQTLLAARRVERELDRWRQAQTLAIDGIELARAARAAEARTAPVGWSRTVDLHSGPLPGLVHIEVEVAREPAGSQRVRLSTWVWQP